MNLRVLKTSISFSALLLVCALLFSCGGTVNVIPGPPAMQTGGEEDKAPAVQGVRLNLESATLAVGQSTLLSPSVLPLDAENRGVRYASSDESVVKVNGRGRITGLARGSAAVTVTTEEGGFTASCAVTVKELEHHVEGEDGVRVESVTLSESSLAMQVGDEALLSASVLPVSAQNQGVTWLNSNTRAILLEDGGRIKAVGAGRAVVTAISEDGGKSAACEITVTAKLQSLSLSSDAVTLAAGAALQLTPVTEPAELPNLTLTYRSSKTSVATVSDKGLITARAPGTAIVSVQGDGKTAACTVTVTSGGPGELAALAVRQSSMSLQAGESMTLLITKVPGNAASPMTFTSSDPTVAHISDTGIVTGVQPGTATVTVSARGGGVKKSCPVTVTEGTEAHKIYVSRSDLSLAAGESFLLESGLSGHPEEGEKVLFFSSHPEVATVDEGGRITAVSGGSTVISAVLSLSGYTAVCNLSVQGIPVESVTLDETEVTMRKGEQRQFHARVLPAAASEKTVSYFISDPSKAMVTGEGSVLALASGDVTLTVQTLDGKKTARCLIHIR